MASTREPLLHAVLLLLARLFLLHVFGVYIVRLIRVFVTDPYASNHPGRGSEHGVKVIACGFSRSGTKSLQWALQRLGFPCYHALDIRTSPGHAELWLNAAAGKLDDWACILDGYTAIVDFPAACLYKELMAAYPNAKIILNIRDPEQWYESCSKTVYKVHCNLLMRMFRVNIWRVANVLLFQGKFKGRFGDKEFAIGVYKQHIEEVKRVVPKEKLLVYEVQEGWIPLCNFLEVEIPGDTPSFPRIHDSSSYRGNLERRLMVLRMALAVYVALVSILVVAVVKCITSYAR